MDETLGNKLVCQCGGHTGAAIGLLQPQPDQLCTPHKTMPGKPYRHVHVYIPQMPSIRFTLVKLWRCVGEAVFTDWSPHGLQLLARKVKVQQEIFYRKNIVSTVLVDAHSRVHTHSDDQE